AGRSPESLILKHTTRRAPPRRCAPIWCFGDNRAETRLAIPCFGAAIAAKMRTTCLALVTVVTLSGAAIAANAAPGPDVIVLGETSHYPESGCPGTRGCQVVARLTGLQLSADGSGHPFLSPVNGQVVAWWLKLPQLSNSQFKSFSDLFGGAPTARLAILRRVRHGHFRLVRE